MNVTNVDLIIRNYLILLTKGLKLTKKEKFMHLEGSKRK